MSAASFLCLKALESSGSLYGENYLLVFIYEVCYYLFLDLLVSITEGKGNKTINKVARVCRVCTIELKSIKNRIFSTTNCLRNQTTFLPVLIVIHQQFQFLPSGSWVRLPLPKTNRFKHSFVSSAVCLNGRRKGL